LNIIDIVITMILFNPKYKIIKLLFYNKIR
jgi:hypothetical protein